MSSKQGPTQEDARQAVDRLLTGLENDEDLSGVLGDIRALHPRNNTFPGEVFMRLAADALAEGGVSPASPISEESLVETYLPECRFWGRDNQKMRFALLVAGATHAGVEVDLLDEVVYWGTDDFWSYAASAAVVWIRAVAASRGIPLIELCGQLRSKYCTL